MENRQEYFCKLILDGEELNIGLTHAIGYPHKFISSPRSILRGISYGWKNYSYRTYDNVFCKSLQPFEVYECWKKIFEYNILNSKYLYYSQREIEDIPSEKQTICYIDTDEYQWDNPKKLNWKFKQISDNGEEEFFNNSTGKFALQELLT